MIKLKIDGMTCSHCVAMVTEVLESVPGIVRVVRIDLDYGEVLVEGTPESRDLVAAVEQAGYRTEFAR